jgi:hypothetical protein
MKNFFMPIILIFTLVFSSVAMANSSQQQTEATVEHNLPLSPEQEAQLKYEGLYLGKIKEEIKTTFGSFDQFYEYGIFNMKHENGFKFIFSFSEQNAKTEKLKQIISREVPDNLTVFRVVDLSYNELKNIQKSIRGEFSELRNNGATTISTFVDSYQGKVVLEVDTINASLKNNLQSEYGDILEIVEGVNYEKQKSRTDDFTLMGGGIAVESSNCSTAATATKDSREFLITAGHCLDNIGGDAYQNSQWVGTEHWSGEFDGLDIGIYLLKDTSRDISNHFFYNPTANAEYDKRYDGIGEPILNELVCKSGITTDVTCGTVTDTSGSVSYPDGTSYDDMIKIEKDNGRYSDGGDSGAITFDAYDYTLYGVHQGGSYDSSTDYSIAWASKVTNLEAKLSETNNPFKIYISDSYKDVDPNN